MVDVDTFLTTLYVMVDDFCQSHPPKRRPGPEASLSESEVVTLAIFARWARFGSERDFYRYAKSTCGRPSLPCPIALSSTAWCARTWISSRSSACTWRRCWEPRECPYEALDSSAMPVRDAKRRGAGWLAGLRRHRMVQQPGMVRGFPSARRRRSHGGDHRLRLLLRLHRRPAGGRDLLRRAGSPNPRMASVGSAASGPYVADKGFEGAENHRRWLESYGARVICPPKRNAHSRMAQALEALGGWHPPDRGDRLRQALQHLRSVAGAAPRAGGVASAIGGEGGFAQLLHLAQRATRSPPAGLRRLAGMVISELTPSV